MSFPADKIVTMDKLEKENEKLRELLREACLNLNPATYSGVTEVRIFLKKKEVKEVIE